MRKSSSNRGEFSLSNSLLLVVFSILSFFTIKTLFEENGARQAVINMTPTTLANELNLGNFSFQERVQLFFSAVDKGFQAKIQLILDSGISVDTRDENGNTAMMRAAEKGDLRTCKFLKEKGAKINEQGFKGFTALMKSVSGAMVRHKNVDCVRWLVEEANADPRIQNDQGNTAYDLTLPVWGVFKINSPLTPELQQILRKAMDRK
jgi:ankyrin repeat protein